MPFDLVSQWYSKCDNDELAIWREEKMDITSKRNEQKASSYKKWVLRCNRQVLQSFIEFIIIREFVTLWKLLKDRIIHIQSNTANGTDDTSVFFLYVVRLSLVFVSFVMCCFRLWNVCTEWMFTISNFFSQHLSWECRLWWVNEVCTTPTKLHDSNTLMCADDKNVINLSKCFELCFRVTNFIYLMWLA